MTIELTKSEQAFVYACEARPHDMTTMDLVAIIRKLQANAAPCLVRIAELEAENKALRETAAAKRIKCNSCRVEMWDTDPSCPNCGDDQEDRGGP